MEGFEPPPVDPPPHTVFTMTAAASQSEQSAPVDAPVETEK
jgi:hypothetical protein